MEEKLRKIGILTFSYGSNYGGMLQSLGLYKSLQSLGNQEIEIINYIPKNSYSLKRIYLSGAKTNNKIDLKKLFIKVKYAKNGIIKFDKFREQAYKITSPISEEKIKDKLNEYSTVIVGSDQVWNVSNSMNGVYFFEGIDKIKKISYAACSGQDIFQKEDKQRLENALNDFNYISVRNEHTYKFVKRLINKEAEVVCDPSILYDYKEYLSKEKSKEKYILTYILGNEINGGHEQVIKKIKEKVGNIKVIAIGIAYATSGSLQFYPWADKVLYNADPVEWLNLINNAEFVYTDSYHGVLFSMKFHKNFLAYYSEKARASRFVDLAERYQVDRYIVDSVETIDNKKSLEGNIDYGEIDVLLEKHRKYSMDFLKEALGEDNE